MRSAITCIGFTRATLTRALILAFAAGLRRCSQTAVAKSSCLTLCSSPCPARRSFITEMRLAWGTTFILAIATAAARQCSGVPTATRDFQGRIRSNSTCRLRSTPNTTTKRSTSRTSKKISHPCSGGCAALLRCGKISRRSHAVPSNFSFRITQKYSRFSGVTKTRLS